MSKNKNIKTNAVRLLERSGVDFEAIYYEGDEFLDGVSIAEKLNQPKEITFKTLVTIGKSKTNYVFVIPVAEELDLKKAAAAVNEKSVEMINVKDILKTTGYIRGGCSPIGMKKQFVTVFDSSALEHREICFSGGKRGVQIKMQACDIEKIIKCSFENIIL